MIDTSPQAPLDLKTRTRARNQSVWAAMLGNTALAQDEAAYLSLYADTSESYLAVNDEVFAVKVYEVDETNQIEQDKVAQEKLFADLKAATERTKIAMRLAADDYIYAARLYDNTVKSLVMTAREYANTIEVETLNAAAQEKELGVEKEALRTISLNAQIIEAGIDKAMVEADVAREQVAAAKANVEAVMAGIAAQEAQIKIADTQLAIAMTDAEKLTLQADIQKILAEIMLKFVNTIRLATETQAIQEGFGFVYSKLTDMLAIYAEKDRIEQLRTMNAQQLYNEALSLLTVEEAGEDLQITAIDDELTVQGYEQTQQVAELAQEQALENILVAAKEGLQNAEASSRQQLSTLRMQMEFLVNAARMWVFLNRTHMAYNSGIWTDLIGRL
jgi:hypothetical protein